MTNISFYGAIWQKACTFGGGNVSVMGTICLENAEEHSDKSHS